MSFENMKITKAKDLFGYGVLTKAQISTTPMGSGWCVELYDKNGAVFLIETDRGEVRSFKTVDTAFKAVVDIGFQTATVTKI